MNWRSECLSHEALSARKAATTSLGRLNFGHQMALVFNSKISPPAKTKNKEKKRPTKTIKQLKTMNLFSFSLKKIITVHS